MHEDLVDEQIEPAEGYLDPDKLQDPKDPFPIQGGPHESDPARRWPKPEPEDAELTD